MATQVRSLVESLREVKDCHAVRVRTSGPSLFIDVHVSLDENLTLKEVHQLTDQVEARVQQAIPKADVTIHPEPCAAAPLHSLVPAYTEGRSTP